MKYVNEAIIVDIDGTLANCDHRRHLVENKKWDEFYAAMDADKINTWCADLIWAAQQELRWAILFVSGRPEKYRKTTDLWIRDNADIDAYAGLFMRKDGDFRQDAIIKKEIYLEHIEPNYDVRFCVDDRKQVVDMWRSLGLVCLQCAEGNF